MGRGTSYYLSKGFSISCFSKGLSLDLIDRIKTSESSKLPILGTPNLPIGSLRVGHVPRHKQSLLGVTPVDSPGDGWSVSQLQPVFLGWCHPGAAPESKPEPRAKPAEGGESLEARELGYRSRRPCDYSSMPHETSSLAKRRVYQQLRVVERCTLAWI